MPLLISLHPLYTVIFFLIFFSTIRLLCGCLSIIFTTSISTYHILLNLMRNFLPYLFALVIGLQAFGQSQHIDSLENELTKPGLEKDDRTLILINLSYWYSMKQLPDKALERLDEAASLVTKQDSLKFKPLLYQEYSRIYLTKGEFLKGLATAANLEKFADAEKDRIMLESKSGEPKPSKSMNTGDAYAIIGEIHRKMGDFQKALEYALKSLEVAELLGKQALMANCYNNIGIIYKEQDDLEQSKKYYFKAMKLNNQLPNREYYTGSNYNNIGIIYRNTKQYDSALICYQNGLKYIQSPYGKATIYNNIGAVFYDLKVYDSAQYYHQNALSIQKEQGYNEQVSLSMISLAQVMNKMGRHGESLKLGLEAYQMNEKENSYDLLSDAAEALSEAYNGLGDLASSLFYFKKYKQYQDSLYNENKRKEIISQQLRFETREREKENELLRKKAELSEAKIKFQYIIGIVLVAVLLLSVWVLYLNIKRNKIRHELANQKLKNEQTEKRYLEKELTFKNQELVNFSLQIVEKNDFITEVTREIDKLSKIGINGFEKVKELSKKLKANYIINKHQKEFDAHVNSVYESFYNKLEDKYPGLTQNEKRLAALLRLKLSSKEISSITGISSKSVDMSRYRLRKKLGLETEDNLIEILNQV